MNPMRRLIVLAFISIAAWAQDAGLRKLEAEMERVSRIAGGQVGAAVVHVESGRTALLNASDSYPMASAYKVPIAVKLLDRVDAGQERLDRMIELLPGDLHPGSGTLTPLFNKPGISLSVRNLLELMLLISDNSATDIILRLAGGPEAVTARMRELDFTGIQVSRPTALMIADWIGVREMPPADEWTMEKIRAAFNAVPEDERRAAAARYPNDPRDSATPSDMARLLVKIHKRELHRSATAELLVDIMRRCQTGDARLKGILPAGTAVAHKTGTVGSTTNDVGIVTLPVDAGHIAVAVFVKASDQPVAKRERAIAEIARVAHDYFLFQ